MLFAAGSVFVLASKFERLGTWLRPGSRLGRSVPADAGTTQVSLHCIGSTSGSESVRAFCFVSALEYYFKYQPTYVAQTA